MFLNPWLLLGVSGICVPIIIHLLNERKFQRVVWAAMRFVQISVEKNRQRMLIENLILLLLRCLIIVLLAFALARPMLPYRAKFLGPQPVTAVLLMDQSGSMNESDGVQTRYAGALKAADGIVAGLPSGSSAAVILVSDIVRDLVPQPTVDLNLVRSSLARTTATDRGTDLLPGLKRAYETLAAVRGANKVLYLITDGQASGWRQGGEVTPDILKMLDDNKEQVEAHVLMISDHDTRNLLVSGLRIATELPTVNKPLRFEVDVTNAGASEVRDVPVRLFADGEATPVDEGVVGSIPPQSTKSISLRLRLGSDGYHLITARIPQDAMAADDERSLVMRVLGEVQVLLVDGDAGRQAQEEDAFFVRHALTPVPEEQQASYFIKTTTISAAELEQTSLEKFDVVVLANVAELSQSTVVTLERLVGQGRGLLVFSGPRVNTQFYRDVLYRQHGLLPAWFGDPHGEAAGPAFETLQSRGFDHPITNAWNQEGQGNPATAHLFRMNDLMIETRATSWPVTDSPPGPTAIVAKYANGKTAMAEHSFGQGRVVLIGTTANTAWTDLPARGSLFVPLVQRLLDRVLHRQEESLNVGVGQRLKLRCPGEQWGKDVRISRPARAGGADELTRVDMVDNWPTLIYDGDDISGVYGMTMQGAGADQPGMFAVHTKAEESNLEELTPKELQTLALRATLEGSELGGLSGGMARGAGEWWRFLITVGLVMVAVESVLAFWFSRVK